MTDHRRSFHSGTCHVCVTLPAFKPPFLETRRQVLLATGSCFQSEMAFPLLSDYTHVTTSRLRLTATAQSYVPQTSHSGNQPCILLPPLRTLACNCSNVHRAASYGRSSLAGIGHPQEARGCSPQGTGLLPSHASQWPRRAHAVTARAQEMSAEILQPNPPSHSVLENVPAEIRGYGNTDPISAPVVTPSLRAGTRLRDRRTLSTGTRLLLHF